MSYFEHYVKEYRKKPVVIKAMRLSDEHDFGNAQQWMGEETDEYPSIEWDDGYVLYIHTLEGIMTATVGDYLIQGVAGEFYPCKPEIFAQTYELVETDATA